MKAVFVGLIGLLMITSIYPQPTHKPYRKWKEMHLPPGKPDLASLIYGWPFVKLERIMKRLNLTEEQKSQLLKLTMEFKKTTVGTFANLLNAWIDIEYELAQTKPDQKKINRTIDEGAKMLADLAKEAIAKWLEFKEILTDEQREKLKALIPW